MGCVGSRVDVEANDRQYNLKKLIASGGFSQIYSAEDLESGRRVAIKRITCHSREEVERTYREIEAHRRFGADAEALDDDETKAFPSTSSSQVPVANGDVAFHATNGDRSKKTQQKYVVAEDRVHLRLNNNNCNNGLNTTARQGGSRFVMPIFGVSEERLSNAQTIISFSLVFPLCKLGSLQDELMTRRATKDYISSVRVTRLFRQVCSALEILHKAKPPIAHRDLKPANLLLKSPDHLLLTDFGSAMECPIVIGDARQRRAVLDAAAEFCTMPYRAPELFTCETGTQLNESVDIWSLGCVLYAMCYFCSPYDEVHERGDSVALAVQSARLKFDKEAPFDESMTSLISSLIRFEPDERPRISEILEHIDTLKY